MIFETYPGIANSSRVVPDENVADCAAICWISEDKADDQDYNYNADD